MSKFAENGPYSLKPLKTTWFGGTEFGVYFEDTHVRSTTLSCDEAKDLVNLLNTAWTLGFHTGQFGERFSKKLEITA